MCVYVFLFLGAYLCAHSSIIEYALSARARLCKCVYLGMCVLCACVCIFLCVHVCVCVFIWVCMFFIVCECLLGWVGVCMCHFLVWMIGWRGCMILCE